MGWKLELTGDGGLSDLAKALTDFGLALSKAPASPVDEPREPARRRGRPPKGETPSTDPALAAASIVPEGEVPADAPSAEPDRADEAVLVPEETPTREVVRKAMLEVVNARGNDPVRAILKEFGVAKLSELPERLFGEALAKLEVLLRSE